MCSFFCSIYRCVILLIGFRLSCSLFYFYALKCSMCFSCFCQTARWIGGLVFISFEWKQFFEMNVEMRFRLNFLATLLRSIFTLVLRHYKRRTRPYQTIAFSIIFFTISFVSSVFFYCYCCCWWYSWLIFHMVWVWVHEVLKLSEMVGNL